MKPRIQRLVKKRTKRPGLPPGTLIYTGERRIESVRITVLDYDEASVREKQITSVQEGLPFKSTPGITWINIDGLHEVSVIEELGRQWTLHPLILEDILNIDQRPKCEDFDAHLFVVLKMLSYDDSAQCVRSEQVSVILGSHFVLSFQETIGDVFDPVRERIRSGKGRIRRMGPDYLVYALMDTVVDSYFTILEKMGERIDALEDELMTDPGEQTLRHIHELKRQMIFLRRSVWPLRELLSGLQRTDSALVKESTQVYLRDVCDHTIQIIDTVENLRDMVSGMQDIYLSSISNKTNAVMKVLTIIATLFIPLTFVAGIYGMNFEHMPELGWRYGYAAVWGIIIAISVGMIAYFRRKKWL